MLSSKLNLNQSDSDGYTTLLWGYLTCLGGAIGKVKQKVAPFPLRFPPISDLDGVPQGLPLSPGPARGLMMNCDLIPQSGKMAQIRVPEALWECQGHSPAHR